MSLCIILEAMLEKKKKTMAVSVADGLSGLHAKALKGDRERGTPEMSDPVHKYWALQNLRLLLLTSKVGLPIMLT